MNTYELDKIRDILMKYSGTHYDQYMRYRNFRDDVHLESGFNSLVFRTWLANFIYKCTKLKLIDSSRFSTSNTGHLSVDRMVNAEKYLRIGISRLQYEQKIIDVIKISELTLNHLNNLHYDLERMRQDLSRIQDKVSNDGKF